MNFYTVVVLVLTIVLAQANPARIRRDGDQSQRYCLKHYEHYDKFCREDSQVDRALSIKVSKFCPAFEKICNYGKAGLSEMPDLGAPLVLPPSLPRGNDVASLDLPISEERKPSHTAPRNPAKLTTAIVATCTPECTAAHCTDECKCAHTHPKVHQMCNPPSSASMAATCQRWYAKCTMFTPVQY